MSKLKIVFFVIALILAMCLGAYLITIAMQEDDLNNSTIGEEENIVENTENEIKEIGTESIVKSDFGKMDDNRVFTENSTINGKEYGIYNPVIPKGFKPIDNRDSASISSEASWGEYNVRT